MHELAVAYDIIETINREVSDDFSNISAIQIEIGTFSGIVRDSLEFGLELISRQRGAEHIRMEITQIPTIAKCACGNQYEMKEIFDPCPKCGSMNRKLVRGTDVIIQSVELKDNTLTKTRESSCQK